MNRIFPKSLFGQTLLILLAGLFVSHAIGSWIYTADREQAVRTVGGFAAAQRIANLTRLVHEAPGGWRERIVAALSDQTLRVSLSTQPPVIEGAREDQDISRAIKERNRSTSRTCSRRAMRWVGSDSNAAAASARKSE